MVLVVPPGVTPSWTIHGAPMTHLFHGPRVDTGFATHEGDVLPCEFSTTEEGAAFFSSSAGCPETSALLQMAMQFGHLRVPYPILPYFALPCSDCYNWSE